MRRWSWLVPFIAVVCALSAAGQAPERYVVSARAGAVNFVSGQAFVSRAGGAQTSLLRQDTIDAGDVASTGEGAYAEVLLDPGSYLRLGPNSQFRFASTSLENTSVELLTGSAIFEINVDNAFVLSVITPSATLRLDHSGIYRIDLVPPPGAIEVVKGSALVGNTEVKQGRLLKLEAGATPEKFDPKATDAFAEWSDSRAKELARVTNVVQTDALNQALVNSYSSQSWEYLPSYSGLWIWDSSYLCGFFLPFGHYGHSRWSYSYYGGAPFNWDHFGWRSRWHHPHVTNNGSGNNGRVAGDHSHSTTNSHGSDHHRDTTSHHSSGDRTPRTDNSGGSQSSTGSHHGGGDGSHHNSSGGSGSHSSRGGGGSHPSGGNGGSHSNGGNGGSHSSSGSHSSNSGSKSGSGSSSSKTNNH